MRLNPQRRRGVSLVEFALVSTVTLLLLAALLSGCLGIFRYQQVAALAREAARYASVHSDGGPNKQLCPGGSKSNEEIYQNVMLPRSTLLRSDKLSHSITWEPNRNLYTSDSASTRFNKVTVVVSYQWEPEILFGGSYTLKSTSVAVLAN